MKMPTETEVLKEIRKARRNYSHHKRELERWQVQLELLLRVLKRCKREKL